MQIGYKNLNGLQATAGEIDIVSKQDIVTYGKNIFDYTKATIGSYVSSTNATIANATFARSDYIKINGNSNYYSSPSGCRFVAFYDLNKTFISGLSSPTLPFVSPANAKYMIVSYENQNANLALLQIENNTSASFFEAFKYQINPAKVDYSDIQKRSDVDRTVMMPTGNLINPLWHNTATANAQLNANGVVATNAAWVGSFVTDYQRFPYKNVTISSGTLGSTMYLAQYDANKKFLQKSGTMYNTSIVTHPDTEYIKLQYYNDLIDKCAVEGLVKNEEIYPSKLSIHESALPSSAYTPQEFCIPSTLYTLQGKQTNIYKKHIVKLSKSAWSINLQDFQTTEECARKVYATAGMTYTHPINLYDQNMVLKQQKTITMKVASPTTDNGAVNMLVIGDSYTSPATWVKKVKDTIPSFTSVGTQMGHSSIVPMMYTEGYSGWSLSSFFTHIHSPAEWAGFSPFMHPSTAHKYYGCTKAVIAALAGTTGMKDKLVSIGFNASTGLLNTPAVNDVMYVYADSAYKTWDGSAWVVVTEASLGFTFNIAKYRSTWGITMPNFSIIMLGINDFAGSNKFKVGRSIWSTFKTQLDTVIASLKADNPNIKIGIAIPNGKYSELPSFDATNFLPMKEAAMYEARKLFIDNYDAREGENLYLLDPSIAIDPMYGLGNITKIQPFEEYTDVGTMTTPLVKVSDVIHPNGYGYNAMGIPIAAWVQSTR